LTDLTATCQCNGESVHGGVTLFACECLIRVFRLPSLFRQWLPSEAITEKGVNNLSSITRTPIGLFFYHVSYLISRHVDTELSSTYHNSNLL